MSYCFMSIEKVKTGGSLMSKYNHNYRLVNVENADPSKKDLNEELIQLPIRDGKQVTPQEMFRERIESLPYYQTHKVRKNAVHALEVVTTFTKDSLVDLNQWKEENVKWMKDTFNVAGDGKDNVISMVYHADEAGNVHCHALVIPIDERGHLNASRFTDGSRTMSEHQTNYAKAMERFGLERGLKNSQAKHKDIKRFYAELNREINRIPEKIPGETEEEYLKRGVDYLKTLYASSYRDLQENGREQMRKVNERYHECRERIQSEFHDRDEIKEEVQELTKIKEKLEDEIDTLKDQLQLQESIIEKSERYDRFKKKMDLFEENHPEEIADLKEDLRFIEQYEPNPQKTSGREI